MATSTASNWTPQPSEQGSEYIGCLKSYHKDGFGFIACEPLFEQFGGDVYVPEAEVRALPEGVTCGSELRFLLCVTKKGPQARNIVATDTRQEDAMASQELMTLDLAFEGLPTAEARGPPARPRARILSWNVLAPAYATCNHLKDAIPRSLRWSRRAVQTANVIGRLDADIICFQEFEVRRSIEELGLKKVEYETVIAQRPDKSDGCVVAWRKDRFKKVREAHVSYDDNLATQDRTGHCAVLVELLPREGPQEGDQKFVVATTHLAWGTLAEEARLSQIQMLMAKASELCGNGRLILCGDFNSIPGGEVHSYLAKTFDSAYADVETLAATSSNANSENGKGFLDTIDYCWLLKNGLRASQRLRLPRKEELRGLLGGRKGEPVPTLVSGGMWPSDHLPLCVEFDL